jgi:hypothetical protein
MHAQCVKRTRLVDIYQAHAHVCLHLMCSSFLSRHTDSDSGSNFGSDHGCGCEQDGLEPYCASELCHFQILEQNFSTSRDLWVQQGTCASIRKCVLFVHVCVCMCLSLSGMINMALEDFLMGMINMALEDSLIGSCARSPQTAVMALCTQTFRRKQRA